MIFLKLTLGILFFFLGWIYLYKSNLVLNFNKIARELIFNDRTILLERKKLAILFFCLSFIALYMSYSSITRESVSGSINGWTGESGKYLMYMAYQDYCSGRYESAIERYQKVLKLDPDNGDAIKWMAYSYGASGEKRKACILMERLLKAEPDNRELLDNLKKLRDER